MGHVHDAEAFPLYWPLDWPRTKPGRRQRARYQVNFARARDEVLRSLRLLGGRHVVVSTNIPLRLDGLPYANTREPEDPGVAVYWSTKDGKPRVMACDRWDRVKDNMRAVGLTLEALRQIERSGASELLERAFAGFAALPAQAGATSWRVTLGLPVTGSVTRDDIDRAFKQKAAETHPDRGGSADAFVQVTQARDAALREVGHG